MYKWFVWSAKLQKYLPCSGLLSISRGECPAVLHDSGYPCFSIPMFGVHNAVNYTPETTTGNDHRKRPP